MEISQRIRNERQTAEWTQEDLSNKIFVSKRTISNWETGKTIPDIESVLRLAKVFHVSLDDLLLENSSVVQELKRKEKLAKLSGLYYIGPVLTAILLLIMMYLPIEFIHSWLLYCIEAAFFTNFITLWAFKWKIAGLKGTQEKFRKELKRMKIVTAVIIMLIGAFIIALHFI